jgi:hypothetical protein
MIYCVYYYYIRAPDFEKVDFNNITFKTGDLLLFKSYNSYIPLVTVIDYCHIGIIIVIDNVPFVLEMYNPCAYLTPLLHKLLENDGGIIFYKKLKKPLSFHQINKIDVFLRQSEQIKYREYMYESNTDSKDNEMVCTEYIYHLLCDAEIINKADYDGTFLLNYLGNLKTTYDDPKYIIFFSALRRYNIMKVLGKAVNGIDVQSKMNEILNMPLINGIWKKQYAKYNNQVKFLIT